MRLLASLAAQTVFFWACAAYADVDVTATPLRDYALPGAFGLTGALIESGAQDATLIAQSTGEGDQARCSIVVATAMDARVYRYGVDEQPTQCVGMTPHPDGGFFLRTRNPQAVPGQITGATVYIDGQGIERWKIRDIELVDAQPRPSGTGAFVGDYLTAYSTLLYSPTTDTLLAFTIGKLTVGIDDKFIAQAHVVKAASGEVVRSGQSIGQIGGGIPVRATVRPDGAFVLAVDTLGLQGLVFYTYDGRETVEELRPLNESWEDRELVAMFFADDALHFVWLDPNDAAVTTEVATTNTSGREILRQTFDSTYRFADGEFEVLGPPSNAWRAPDELVVAHVVDTRVFLRLMNAKDGESPGVARLEGVVAQVPAAIVSTPNGLRLLAWDAPNSRLYEYALAFADAPDFDPNQVLGDVGLDTGIGVDDVLREAGCGCGATDNRAPAELLILALFAFLRRKR